MKLKKGDTLPDAKVFIFDESPKETSIKQIIGEERVMKEIKRGAPYSIPMTLVTGVVDALNELNVKYITERVRTWQDCAIIGKFHRDEELTKSIFGNCCENQGLTLLHGEIYLCPFGGLGSSGKYRYPRTMPQSGRFFRDSQPR